MRRFSKGMLQRAGLAQALVNDPELLFLDEPMSGLDPVGRRLVRDLILAQRQAGKTVLFSTHILSDAETLCDRVAVLAGGRLLSVGPLGRAADAGRHAPGAARLGRSPPARPGLETARRADAVGDRLRLWSRRARSAAS
jgi:ABC-type multidrug transport system ATPase subunit